MTRTIAAIALIVISACAVQDAGDDTLSSADGTASTTADGATPASVPAIVVPDSFSTTAGRRTYDARKAFDLTGDGRPETIAVHAAGPRLDSADVDLVVLTSAGDTLFHDRWNTTLYFMYEYRSTMSDSAANAKVMRNVLQLLADSSFSTGGPPVRLTRAIPGGIDRDAVRYDLKEATVRAKHSMTATQPFTTPLYEEMEKVRVTEASIDSLVTELKTMPTFMYYAGGEASYALAWSAVKQRFVRIFSCC